MSEGRSQADDVRSPGAGPGRAASEDPGRRVDLSRMRHELRTPINHILGYSEMLLEDEQLPVALAADLRRIHAGGQRLQALIADYFSEETFFRARDVHQLYHELRTPVNHIIGYSELLQELAIEQGSPTIAPDLAKIRDAAGRWLELMETYLIDSGPPAGPNEARSGSSAATAPLPSVGPVLGDSVSARVVGPGLGLSVPEPRSAQGQFAQRGAILIVDDDESNRDMLARRLRRHGCTVSAATDGVQALKLAERQSFDLILLDMLMPGLDGFQVLARLKSDPARREIPVIMLSALDDENGIARCIEMGAEDYLSKPFNPVFLWARISACLERKHLRDRERAAFAALQESQRQLAAELAEAAAYVRSLLPAPLTTGPIETDSCFQPGAQLGGDAFGYHWLDDGHFAIYLLDVCGHGVGAALLSVSVLNTLRARTLPGVDFREPGAVLAALNRTFQMDRQNQLYFTIWFGVYRPATRDLIYSSGGHPPALLLLKDGAERVALRQSAPAIGCLDEATYPQGVQAVPPGARLLVLSDGVFEIPRPDGRTGTWAEFDASFAQREVVALRPEERLRRAQEACGPGGLEDDFSFLEVVFRE